MQTFFKRLTLILENQGFKNLNDFALNGLKYDSSSKLNRLKDEKNKPSVEILTDISNKFQNINLDWLITGRGEMLRNDLKKIETPLQMNNEPAEIIVEEKNVMNLLRTQNDIYKKNAELYKEQAELYKEKYENCENEKKPNKVNK